MTKNADLTIEERLVALEVEIADTKAQATATATALDALCLELMYEHAFDGERLATALSGLAEKFEGRSPDVQTYLLKSSERVRTLHEAREASAQGTGEADLAGLLGSIDTCITLHTRAVMQRLNEETGQSTHLCWAVTATVFAGAAGALLDCLLRDRSASAEVFALQLNLLASAKIEADEGRSAGTALDEAMQAAYEHFLVPMRTQDGRLDEDTVGAAARASVQQSPLLALSKKHTSANSAQLAWLGGEDFARSAIVLLAEVSRYAVALATHNK